jgi:hypothetical protein
MGYDQKEPSVPKDIMYWVRSKQTKEPSSFGKHPVPAKFKTLEEANHYRRELNLSKGAYHPGYFVEKQDDTPLPVPLWPKRA